MDLCPLLDIIYKNHIVYRMSVMCIMNFIKIFIHKLINIILFWIMDSDYRMGFLVLIQKSFRVLYQRKFILKGYGNHMSGRIFQQLVTRLLDGWVLKNICHGSGKFSRYKLFTKITLIPYRENFPRYVYA